MCHNITVCKRCQDPPVFGNVELRITKQLPWDVGSDAEHDLAWCEPTLRGPAILDCHRYCQQFFNISKCLDGTLRQLRFKNLFQEAPVPLA